MSDDKVCEVVDLATAKKGDADLVTFDGRQMATGFPEAQEDAGEALAPPWRHRSAHTAGRDR